MTVRAILDSKGHQVLSVEPGAKLADAIKLLSERRIGAVLVMSQGRIEQVGTPDEIYDTPVSPFVFRFIGQSNCLKVRVANGEIWLDDRPIGLPAKDEAEGEALLYFRPHDIEIRDGCGG